MNDLFLNACVLRGPDKRFAPGHTAIANEGGEGSRHGLDALMDFSIMRLRRGESISETNGKETLCVLMQGSATITIDGYVSAVQRSSLFDEGPTAVHAGNAAHFEIRSEGTSEWAVVRTTNPRNLPARLYRNNEFASEDRGAGLAQGACRRIVRTIFDYSTRPDSNLVVGEVVNLPGRWSSYPPHHHPQPEIYHYRFTLPQGYGHAELGDAVFKVRDRDTVLIPGGLDHAQVSAPGYGMYYLWIVRHLPRKPYKGFVYTADHKWLLDPLKQGWEPGKQHPGPGSARVSRVGSGAPPDPSERLSAGRQKQHGGRVRSPDHSKSQ